MIEELWLGSVEPALWVLNTDGIGVSQDSLTSTTYFQKATLHIKAPVWFLVVLGGPGFLLWN